ncbi:MAG: RNA methyltransferase [Acidobacteriota bacterium]
MSPLSSVPLLSMPNLDRPSPAVVLVTPREEGNIGSVARAMANLGLDTLILVEPAPPIGGVARGFGVGGWSILDHLHRVPDLATALTPYHLAVGTTSMRKRPMRRRQVLDVRDLAEALHGRLPPAGRTALVFGPEDNGLSRDQLDLCDPLVTIPCATDRPTLNLAQAVLLVAWELHRSHLDDSAPPTPPPEPVDPATWAEHQTLIDLADPLVHQLGFDHDHIHANVLRDLRRLLERSRPDRREAALLRRLFGRATSRLGAESGQ